MAWKASAPTLLAGRESTVKGAGAVTSPTMKQTPSKPLSKSDKESPVFSEAHGRDLHHSTAHVISLHAHNQPPYISTPRCMCTCHNLLLTYQPTTENDPLAPLPCAYIQRAGYSGQASVTTKIFMRESQASSK